MLLFSTQLKIKDTLTASGFVQLLIDENQSYKEHDGINMISAEKLEKWDHQTLDNVFIDDDKNLKLQTTEYSAGQIMASRFEKKEPDGLFWRTDCIYHVAEGEMSIQLYRVYQENATTEYRGFSTPRFIKFLIRRGYLEDDGCLAVSNKPVIIGEDDIHLVVDAASGKLDCSLPIVYVSKDFDTNKNPVDVKKLADKLRGIAHVLVEEDSSLAIQIAAQSEDKQTFNGAVTVYYPQNKFTRQTVNRRHGYENKKDEFINKIRSLVLDYTNSQEMPLLYTWGSVHKMSLYDRMVESDKERKEANDLVNTTDQEIKDKDQEIKNRGTTIEQLKDDIRGKRDEIHDLTNKISYLRNENKRLTEETKGSHMTIGLDLGEEKEFFTGEAKAMIMAALKQSIKVGVEKKQKRRNDIINSVIKANEKATDVLDQKKEELHSILNNYKGMDKDNKIKRRLNALGITVSEDNDDPKHWKLRYNEDKRYWTTLAKTPRSENSGTETADEFSLTIF